MQGETARRRGNMDSSNGKQGNQGSSEKDNLWRVKVGLAEMLKGGVIMDVTTAEQARIAEQAGACAVMALEALEVDFIDESEVLTPADEENHIWKHDFRVPFVCGARNLGEALRRIAEGAAMIRTKGEAGSGNVVEAVRHMRAITGHLRKLTTLRGDELAREAKELAAPLELVREIARTGKLPVPNFSAGGIATPADAALVRHLGAEAIFVGSGIFKSSDPERRAKAIVKAATHYNDPKIVLEASAELGEAMKGIDVRQLDEKELLQTRGW